MLLAVNRRDGRTVWETDRSLFKFGWSTPVRWRHDGIDEVVVLERLQTERWSMAYNLSDGTERWWIGGLPPCGKARPWSVAVDRTLPRRTSFWSGEAVKRDPARAEQLYANNASRVTAVRPGGKGRSERGMYSVVWNIRVPRRPIASVLPWPALHLPEWRNRLLPRGGYGQTALQRATGRSRRLLLLGRGGRRQGLHCIG